MNANVFFIALVDEQTCVFCCCCSDVLKLFRLQISISASSRVITAHLVYSFMMPMQNNRVDRIQKFKKE